MLSLNYSNIVLNMISRPCLGTWTAGDGAAGVGAGAGAGAGEGAGVGTEGCTKKDRGGESRGQEEESHVSPGRLPSQKPLSKACVSTPRRLQQGADDQYCSSSISIVLYAAR